MPSWLWMHPSFQVVIFPNWGNVIRSGSWSCSPSRCGGYIRPFTDFKPVFLPCQMNSHPLGQRCMQASRREKHVGRKSTNNKNMRGSPQLIPHHVLLLPRQPPPSTIPSLVLCWFVAAANSTTDDRSQASLLTYRPNRNIGCLNVMILSIRGTSHQCGFWSRMLLKSIGHSSLCCFRACLGLSSTSFLKSENWSGLLGLTGAVVTKA